MVKIGIENEDLMKQFKLTVTLPQQEDKKLWSTTKRKGEGAWNHLGLSHSVSWPLHILFTPTILEKYYTECKPSRGGLGMRLVYIHFYWAMPALGNFTQVRWWLFWYLL